MPAKKSPHKGGVAGAEPSRIKGRKAAKITDNRDAEKKEKKQVSRRRRANEPGGRSRRRVIKVTPEEEQKLSSLAQAQGVTVPRLLIESALTQNGETPTERRKAMTDLRGLQRQIAGIAVNINQIAKATNSTHMTQREEADTLQAALHTLDKIDQALERIRS